MKIKNYIPLLFLLLFTSCESFLENELPSNEIRFEEGLNSETGLQELLNSTYDVFANFSGGDRQKLAELLGEDALIEGNAGFLVQVYNRATDFFNSDVGGFYNNPYFAITRANTLLESLPNVEMSESTRARMEGEAKTIRAICHFQLVQLFSQPYGFTADNSHLGIVLRTQSAPQPQPRNTVKEVYDQIIADLKDAENLLPESNGIYLNRYAAKAYLSKVYLNQGDYNNAVSYAEEVINSGKFQFSNDLNNRYQADAVSTEAIFTTISTGQEDNRGKSLRDLFSSATQIPTIKASFEYADLLASNPDDQRNQWIAEANGVKVFTKYNLPYFNVSQITLSEMYLIVAECNGLLSRDLKKAVGYINAIKTRAGVQEMSEDANAVTVVTEARLEKRKEFGGEGISLFDLKRRGARGENVTIRDAAWNCPGMVLQFPAAEIAIKGFELNEEGGCQ